MSTKGIIGTLFLYFDDGDGPYHVASLLSAILSVQTEMKPALHPEAYGWTFFIAGQQGWQLDGEVLQLVDVTTLQREEYLYKIEQLALAKTPINVVFESPTGAQYSSRAYIDQFEIGNGFEDGFRGGFGMVGIDELVLVENENPCGVTLVSGGVGDTTNTHYLGTTPGWVRLDYEMYTVQDQAQLIYDGEIIDDTGGVVSGQGSLYFFYLATPGKPRSIDVRIFAPDPITQWNYVLRCPDPANEPIE